MRNITHKMRLNKYGLDISLITKLDAIEYDEIHENKLKGQIRKYLNENIPIEYLIANWKEIIKLGRDSSSLKSYVLRYGPETGKQLHAEKTKACSRTRADYIEKYGEIEANRILSSRGASLKNYIARYGNIEGKTRWDEYCDKRANTYKQRRGTYASRDLAWFQQKHGDEKGYEIWDKRRKAQAYKVSLQWYIDTYGEDIGRIKCRDAKARDLNFFVRKYGKNIGQEKYDAMRTKIASSNPFRTTSKWADAMCEELKNSISDLYYYGKNELVWQLPPEFQIKLNQSCVMPDLYYKGKIVEFQGDVFHGNPGLFEENDTPHPYNDMTTKELRERDDIRFSYYASKGYQILEIWEDEYYNDKQGTIEKCLSFLK